MIIMSERTDPHVPYIPFEQYQERFKEFFTLTREGGIIECRMHTNGGVAVWDYGHHSGWGKVIKAIGQDPENEVLILGGTGDQWLGPVDLQVSKRMMDTVINDHYAFRKSTYDGQYVDGLDLLWPLLYDIRIPTIGVVNGPANVHTEFPLICDITICATDATFGEPHFSGLGSPTGDGLYLVFQEVFGYKLANNMAFLGRIISAQEAYDLGAVAEVVERDKLYGRAWELASFIMKKDRYARRLQHELAIQRWRRVINADFNLHFMAEEWAQCLADPKAIEEASKMIAMAIDAQESKA